METTYNIESELIGQKNLILEKLSDAEETFGLQLTRATWEMACRQMHEAASMLQIVRSLWLNTDYGYKLREVCERAERICSAANVRVDESDQPWLHKAKVARVETVRFRFKNLKPL